MGYSIYLISNGKYRADVSSFGKRKTKVFDKKSDATRWAKNTQRDLQLNHDTQQSLSLPTFLSFADAFNLYARDVSSLKKQAKKRNKSLPNFCEIYPMSIGPSINIVANLLSNGKSQLCNVMSNRLKPIVSYAFTQCYQLFLIGVSKRNGWLIIL